MAAKNPRPDWPESEPVPRSMEEALALGWEVSGPGLIDVKTSADETVETGMKLLAKNVGLARLSIEVPYRAEFTFGKPCKPEAWPMHDDDIEECLERLYGP